MMNPIAQSFLVAARTRDPGFWEHDQFGNSQNRGPAPRLTPAPGARRRGFLGFLRRGVGDGADRTDL